MSSSWLIKTLKTKKELKKSQVENQSNGRIAGIKFGLWVCEEEFKKKT